MTANRTRRSGLIARKLGFGVAAARPSGVSAPSPFVESKCVDALARRTRVRPDEHESPGGLCGCGLRRAQPRAGEPEGQQHRRQDESSDPDCTRAHLIPECSRKIGAPANDCRAPAPGGGVARRRRRCCRASATTRLGPDASKPDKFSPLGYYDLLAYEQAFPGEARQSAGPPGVVGEILGVSGRRASNRPAGVVDLDQPRTTDHADHERRERLWPRLRARHFSRPAKLDGPCRLWVGTAGGGVWRTDRAMHPDDPGWRWVSHGLGTNNIGSLAIDPSDRSGNTILVGTGETNTPNNSGAGTGLYRSVDGGDRWTRVPTMIVDPAVGPARNRLHVHARHRRHRDRSAQSADHLHRHQHGDAGHDRRARRPVDHHRVSAAARRLVQDRERRAELDVALAATARCR